MDKLLDPSFWGTSWEQFRSAPGVTITLLLVWGAFVWWLRGHLKANEISGLKGQIHILEQRRQLAVEERTAEKKELLEEVDALKKHFAALEGQKIEDEARLDTF